MQVWSVYECFLLVVSLLQFKLPKFHLLHFLTAMPEFVLFLFFRFFVYVCNCVANFSSCLSFIMVIACKVINSSLWVMVSDHFAHVAEVLPRDGDLRLVILGTFQVMITIIEDNDFSQPTISTSCLRKLFSTPSTKRQNFSG